MSLILDALRRADAERERGQVPHLNSQPLGAATGATAGGSRGRPRTAIAAAIGGTVAAVLMGWAAWSWLWPRSPDGARQVVAASLAPAIATAARPPTPQMPPARPEPAAPVAPPTDPTPAAPIVAPIVAPTAAPIAPPIAAPTTMPAAPPTASPATPPTAGLGAPPSAAPNPPTAATTAPTPAPPSAWPAAPARRTLPSLLPPPPATAARPVAPAPARSVEARGASPALRPARLAELPPAQRQAIESLRVGGVVQSQNRRQSFVLIGDQMLREGETVADGVVLERIGATSLWLRVGERIVERAF